MAFKPGQSGNPNGRPAGLPNKLTRTVKEAFGEAFAKLQEDPKAPHALHNWGQANPKEFYQLASKLIPTELDATVRGNLVDVLSAIGKSAGSATDNT